MRRLVSQLGSLILIVCITVGLLEVALRLLNWVPVHKNPISGFHISHPDLGWIGEPDYRGVFATPGFTVEVQHDAQGFRLAADPPGESALDATRIAFLGDSFTWGWGVPRGAVFTDVLATDLGPGYRIRNLGVNAYGTGQQRILMDFFLDQFSPDIVVVMFFSNDLTDNGDRKKDRRPWFELVDGQLLSRNRPVRRKMVSPLKSLMRHSVAISTLKYNYYLLEARIEQVFADRRSAAGGDDQSAAAETATNPEPPDMEKEWQLFGALLADMRTACEKRQPACALHVAYIPTRDEVWYYGERGASGIGRRAGEVSRQVGIPFLDLTAPLYAAWQAEERPARDLTPFYFRTDGHWDERGHDIAALAMSDAWGWRSRETRAPTLPGAPL
ncbi:MAG: SGNH/GDSL hydrolase family protein [Gammaproteobacteria bacterium]|nr:SGNH/GDSL hydrolase family protein [Gammaproteobacteria bacterium]